METVFLIVGSIALTVIATGFAALVIGALRELRKIGQASEDLSRLLRTAEEELAPTMQNARSIASDADQLVIQLTKTAERVDRVAEDAERVVRGTFLTASVVRTLKSSTAGLLSVYEGVKQGIRNLCGSQETDKEEANDEQ